MEPMNANNIKTLKSLKKWLSSDPKNTIDIIVSKKEAIEYALSRCIDVCEIAHSCGGIKNMYDGFQASQKPNLFNELSPLTDNA